MLLVSATLIAASTARDQSRYPAWLGWKQSGANFPVHGGRKWVDTSATGRLRAAASARMVRLNAGIFFVAVHRDDQKTKPGPENERHHS